MSSDYFQHAPAALISKSRRLVVKIGSSLLLSPERGLRHDWLRALGQDIAALKQAGVEVILVSSGAIGLGWPLLGHTARPKRLDHLQASAAVGQIKLAEAYATVFSQYNLEVAQLLITLSDMENRRHYLNARATVAALLAKNAIPIFNENDTVATSEIRFGDNDRLAARIAALAGADTLLLLSDIDGLYDRPPQQAGAQHIPFVADITDDIHKIAGPATTGGPGSGGMVTKLDAAQMATDSGTAMLIANGQAHSPIQALLDGAKATYFPPKSDPLTVRKSWLRGMMAPKGFLYVDAGAEKALKEGASLLPAGTVHVDGVFERGDLVGLMTAHRKVIGQGLSAYPSHEATLIMGRSLQDAEKFLGYGGRPALIHRDDLVLF